MVYKAEHRLTGRFVALKLIHHDLFANEELKSRFLREAKALSKLDHPNVVKLYDAEEFDGLIIVAMEFVEGKTLTGLLEQSRGIPVALACHLVVQAAQGLQYVHEQGLIHRDIKPDNLRLGVNGDVKIMDLCNT